MKFDDVILGRRSIRGYKPDPVPRALIEEIIGLAMRAPSSMNTQPWNFYVVTGEPLERIRKGNTERMAAGVPQSREFRTSLHRYVATESVPHRAVAPLTLVPHPQQRRVAGGVDGLAQRGHVAGDAAGGVGVHREHGADGVAAVVAELGQPPPTGHRGIGQVDGDPDVVAHLG